MASTNMDTRKSVGKHQGRSEGTAALTSISRDKRSGLVVPGGYSPPSKRGHKEELTTGPLLVQHSNCVCEYVLRLILYILLT